MMTLNLLLANKPDWLEVTSHSSSVANVVASPPRASGWSKSPFSLALRLQENGGVSVEEDDSDRLLPCFCAERHINPGGTFCVFYGSTNPIFEKSAALHWWHCLRIFLLNQNYAERQGRWPLEAGLSHGAAADFQIEMEKVATPLGWRDELLRGIFRNKGWLADTLPKVSKNREHLLNSRTPCPRGCTWKHGRSRKKSCGNDTCRPDCKKQHKPILRADCPNRKAIEQISLLEHRRRKEELAVARKLHDAGFRCCNTMKGCSLRDLER